MNCKDPVFGLSSGLLKLNMRGKTAEAVTDIVF